jgi:hypothetical protein
MSKVAPDKAFDRAVDLIINQDHVIQSWTGRYITTQGGLAIAEATLLGWQGANYGLLIAAAAILLAVLGIASAWLITEIIKREYRWQSIYVEAAQRAEGSDPIIYTVEVKPEPGFIARVFLRLRPILVVAWSLFLLLLLAELIRRSV